MSALYKPGSGTAIEAITDYIQPHHRPESTASDRLVVRDAWLRCHKANSDYLFFAIDGVYACLSGNGIRTIKAKVEAAIRERFEPRDCRHFCGQHYLVLGLTIEEVARLLGHNTSKTTEIYYCRRNNAEVARKVKEVW